MKHNWMYFAAAILGLIGLSGGPEGIQGGSSGGNGGGSGGNSPGGGSGGLDGPTNPPPPPLPPPFPPDQPPANPNPPEVRPPGVPDNWVFNGSSWVAPTGDGVATVDSWGNVLISWPDGTFSWQAINGDGSVDHGTSAQVQQAEKDWARKYIWGGQNPPWAGPEF